MPEVVLLTGASGFVGRRVHSALVQAGWDVRLASRDGKEKARQEPELDWVAFDVEKSETLGAALQGVSSVLYLVHSMGQGGDFEVKERTAAHHVLRAAERAGVRRIVYLGGVQPAGEASKHLRSRMETGEILRSGSVSVIELRAGMIIGAGGLSWRMVRDLAARLPFMILPSWLQNHSQPVAIDDVVFALVRALELPETVHGVFDLPGPEVLTGEEVLQRIGRLLGIRAYTIRVPVLTPRLSSYWLKLVTRANLGVAQELVEGLTSDLLARDEGFWRFIPDHARTPFDDAARAALAEDQLGLDWEARALEWTMKRLGRRA